MARSAASSNREGASPTALSPEQLRGETLDERADLFALGCLLYRMLSGEHPFFRCGRLDTELLLECSPRPLADVVSSGTELPEQLVVLVGELLQKNPQRRPPSTRRVRHVLRLLVRDLPLSSRDSLVREAGPYFRREMPEDLPPSVPEELGTRGRSALLPDSSGRARLRHWLQGLRWPSRVALLVSLLMVADAPWMAFRLSIVTPIRFDQPDTSFPSGIHVPREISDRWLLRQVKAALGEQLGSFKVVGEVGAPPETALYPQGKPRERWQDPEQAFQIALRCVDELCVFIISREQAGDRSYRQSVLLPDMAVTQWREVIQATTHSLYQ